MYSCYWLEYLTKYILIKYWLIDQMNCSDTEELFIIKEAKKTIFSDPAIFTWNQKENNVKADFFIYFVFNFGD